MANSATPSTIVTALGAPTAAAPQARAATAAVTAMSAWLTRIVHLPQVVYDDVPGVVDARHIGNVIELGQAGQRQRDGALRRASREVRTRDRRRLAEPPVNQDVAYLLAGSSLDVRCGQLRRGVQECDVAERILVTVPAEHREIS